jgi:hypothetical protein
MKLYSAKVRLGGNLLNEVWVANATAAELQLLVRIHSGGDNFPLAEVNEIGSVARPDRKERARLLLKYLEWNLGNGSKLITEVLGHDNIALPQSYNPPIADEIGEYDFDKPEMTEEEGEAVQLETPVSVIAPRRTRVPRGGLAAADVVVTSEPVEAD